MIFINNDRVALEGEKKVIGNDGQWSSTMEYEK